jgi:hypothetical protein
MYKIVNQMPKPLINQFFLRITFNKSLWKIKLPLKVKIFVWFLLKEVTLTKDNLLKQIEMVIKSVVFMATKETIQHLFSFLCHVARFVWTILFI